MSQHSKLLQNWYLGPQGLRYRIYERRLRWTDTSDRVALLTHKPIESFRPVLSSGGGGGSYIGRTTSVCEINAHRNPVNAKGFGAMDVTKLYEFTWSGDIHGPKPYKFIGFGWALMSQTPVLSIMRRSPGDPGSQDGSGTTSSQLYVRAK